ncbi:MAG: DUF3021 domain-containing protein [Bacillota bacterium]|nr:DUF3021 domain-containing protein [Bacillota bacterium]
MKKRLLVRLLAGLVSGVFLVHVITLLVNYASLGQHLVCMPELTEKLGPDRAIVFQTILGAICGMVAHAGMCFFDIEKWSLLRASVVHCALILITFLPIGLQLYWFSFDLVAILIMAFAIILVYALIWLIMYIAWKRDIRQMNRLAEEYKKSIDSGAE